MLVKQYPGFYKDFNLCLCYSSATAVSQPISVLGFNGTHVLSSAAFFTSDKVDRFQRVVDIIIMTIALRLQCCASVFTMLVTKV